MDSLATVIPFAQPLSRAVLRPSEHARGARNYVFRGEVDEWHAPGVQTVRQQTKAAIDGAWLVQHVLGAPKRSPSKWPGVPEVRERALYYGKHVGLYDYQQEGAAFLAERDYAVLADEMGIGKSSQAIIGAESRLSVSAIPSIDTPVVLILAPAIAKRHWQREVKKWTGLEASVLESLTPSELPRTRYVIANYDILLSARRSDSAGVVHDAANLPGWGPTLAAAGFLVGILDEGHMLRGRGSRRTSAVKTLCKTIPVVWALTGTPMPNYVRDLWSLVDLISGGLWGGYWDWARKYCAAHQAQYGWIDNGSDNLEELGRRLSFFMLGRSTVTVKLALPEKRREIFKIDVQVTAPTVHEGKAAQNMTKSGFVAKALRMTAAAKRSAVVQQAVEALEAKQKVVVFLYMREQADAVAKAVKAKIDCHVACVHGDMTTDGRDAQATIFRDAQAPAAFVATIDSVGLAISLVGADLVIFGDLVPEPWKLVQAEKRCHRHGSTNRVLVRYLIATGTLDEHVAESVVEKLGVIEKALGQQSDHGEMKIMLGGRTDESIIDSLFEKLKKGAAE